VPVVEVSPLEIARRARGLSQTDLARLADVSRETVSMIERGSAPTVRTGRALARVLGVGLDELFPLEDEQPSGQP
jgi:putative transcriptional regulator